MIQFPKDFLWGSSTSGVQSEGYVAQDGKGESNWDYWFKKEPYKFHQGIGPQKASTFYENYVEDIEFLEKTGHTAFRTSIQWSRLMPNGVGEVNQQAVVFYRDMFKRIIDKNIKLIVNLYHFDIPYALQKNGGWENKETVYAYAEYAKECFALFGDLVDTWITFNEPYVPVECGYLYQYHYPCKVDAKAAVQVAYNTQLASALAIKHCHEQHAHHRISIVLNLTPAYPRSQHPEDVKAAHIAELFQARSFLDPSVKGEYPQELIDILKEHQLMPEYTQDELRVIKENTVDFLGVNYYQPLRVAAPKYAPHPNSPFFPEHYYDHYVMPGRKMNPHRGWEIYERGIYDIAMNIKNNYGNIDWILTENGMGVEGEEKYCVDGIIQDDYRIDFFKGHLIELHRAIQDGANCQGYLVWTFIDCWSWLNAYKNRYGLVSLDLQTQQKTIKKSGYWFKELSQNNGF
ncbi:MULTISPECIES: glycoside hydrolase family 1 protein [unclassified Granulicatella]|uniref:glycoside hydrolase family 1 protein n=1 Tax=unclassified Granulicatella TaxID=2630493 RepID=UPI001073C55A|nr:MULTISPECIES: glycoside hydrolase family 1 protein [unclassified Granulicatella]MBF0779562.1 glycoside hydrolase family 1 protein [Granulicatella sp. 19428wC4_WM01]TFU96368.1 glycoside hydrolase family 1 protein [Granulicatella sp. WM01]